MRRWPLLKTQSSMNRGRFLLGFVPAKASLPIASGCWMDPLPIALARKLLLQNEISLAYETPVWLYLS
jgi:hypothetical protein